MFEVGQRVEAQPWTASWWLGLRYGRVVLVGRKYVHVRMDGGRGRVRKFHPDNLREVEE